MNNRLISYEEAKEQLKKLEIKQKYAKIIRRGHASLGFNESEMSKNVYKYKIEINKLLTIIDLHKQTRKLWYERNHWKLKYLGVPCE